MAFALSGYVAVLALVTGRLENVQVRALVYSLPVPMGTVLLSEGLSPGGVQYLGVLLLGGFFWAVVAGEGLRLARLLATLMSCAVYVLAAGLLVKVWSYGSAASLLLALAIWGVVALAVSWRPNTDPVVLVPITRQRVLLVAIVAVVAVFLGQWLGQLLVTFPFVGVAIALTYKGPLSGFARSFWLSGILALLTFLAVGELSADLGLVLPVAVLLGFAAWIAAVATLRVLAHILRARRVRAHSTRVAELLLRDPGQRGVNELQSKDELADNLRAAVASLLAAKSVAIVTGFPIPSVTPPTPETDGPVGSAALALALIGCGVPTVLITDSACSGIVATTAAASHDHFGTPVPVLVLTGDALGAADQFDVVVFVERPGRASDGLYYSMRATEIKGLAPLDALPNYQSGATVIGIGDGGNEAGMGSLHGRVVRSVPNGERIASIVMADHVIVSGTSNWGAHGLACLVRLAARPMGRERKGLPSIADADARLLSACVGAGAVDGVLGVSQATVDGLDVSTYSAVLAELDVLVTPRHGIDRLKELV